MSVLRITQYALNIKQILINGKRLLMVIHSLLVCQVISMLFTMCASCNVTPIFASKLRENYSKFLSAFHHQTQTARDSSLALPSTPCSFLLFTHLFLIQSNFPFFFHMFSVTKKEKINE